MSGVMEGKFAVWGDGRNVYLTHGRDITEESSLAYRETLIEAHGPQKGNRLADLLTFPPTPDHLRTGVTDPQALWLPREVFLALVVRVYEEILNEAEIEAHRGETAWEKTETARSLI